MVHSMLFTNCVKEQCYREEEEEPASKHMCTRAGGNTHTNTIGPD